MTVSLCGFLVKHSCKLEKDIRYNNTGSYVSNDIPLNSDEFIIPGEIKLSRIIRKSRYYIPSEHMV